jgi:hypothetical protein
VEGLQRETTDMSVELVKGTLAWSAVLNMGILIWWFLFIALAPDWVYKMHSKFYKISREHFDTIHYAGMTFYKICIFSFFIVPYLALRIMS